MGPGGKDTPTLRQKEGRCPLLAWLCDAGSKWPVGTCWAPVCRSPGWGEATSDPAREERPGELLQEWHSRQLLLLPRGEVWDGLQCPKGGAPGSVGTLRRRLFTDVVREHESFMHCPFLVLRLESFPAAPLQHFLGLSSGPEGRGCQGRGSFFKPSVRPVLDRRVQAGPDRGLSCARLSQAGRPAGESCFLAARGLLEA